MHGVKGMLCFLSRVCVSAVSMCAPMLSALWRDSRELLSVYLTFTGCSWSPACPAELVSPHILYT